MAKKKAKSEKADGMGKDPPEAANSETGDGTGQGGEGGGKKKKKKSGEKKSSWIWGYINLSSFATLLMFVYLYNAFTNMRTLLYPLDGVEIAPGTEMIKPLWPAGEPLQLHAYISSSARPSVKAFNRSKEMPMLWKVSKKKDGLVHSWDTEMPERNLELLAPDELGEQAEEAARVRLATKDSTGGSVLLTVANWLFDDGAPPTGELVTLKTKRIWDALRSNGSAYLHVQIDLLKKEPAAQEPHYSLQGTVQLVKYAPRSKDKPKRWLLQDVGLGHWSGVTPRPTKSEWAARALAAREALDPRWVALWKPEVAVRLVVDNELYPERVPTMAHTALHALQSLPLVRMAHGPGGLRYRPTLHVDEIGLTSDKYIRLNETAASLPLRMSFEPMAPARLRLIQHLEEALRSQSELGFAESDIDDVRRLISDTNVYLLAVTMVASVLHLLFEFLAFKSDINFWRHNKSLSGLSVRSLFIEFFCQLVILLYLVDLQTSLLVTVPSTIGLLIQAWKCQRACGFQVVLKNADGQIAPRLAALRLEEEAKRSEATAKSDDAAEKKKAERIAETMKVDQQAIKHLTLVLLPIVIGFSLRSLVSEQHASWYSWFLASLTGTVYTFGFILMTPQLFINHHLKSVSHLPWKFLGYRFINTFIDDLFAFIIRMPTMHRISCFRDDVVFIIYLYQRWIYPVDTSRGMATEDMAR